ncbi:MAG: hypothetical protein JWO06_2176 [Bacteroidota bacterium]|nr:hypothetical protein [Bacteroidota bacterium]
MRKFLFQLLIALVFAAPGFAQADFTPDKMSGCPPLVVNFADNTSFTPTSWTWNFGNGNTSTLQNPAATFLSSGTFQVKLIASNGTQTDSMIKTITVFRLPVVDFTADKPVACQHDTLHFTNNITLGDAGIANYAWGFGNGIASSNPNTQYVYNTVGSYTITLVVQDSNGCSANKTISQYINVHPAPTAAFTASPVKSCLASQLVNFTNQSAGGSLTYFWDLADGVTSTLTNPSRTFTQEIKNVKLYATDTNGCTGVAVVLIKVTDITADFKATKTAICTGEKTQFTNTSNFPGSSWLWDFGDGTTSTDFSPIKTYTQPGKYTVNFVEKDGACGDSLKKVQYINVISGFTVSTATFSADSTISCGTPITVHFTNNTPGGSTYHWDFGDGDTSNLQNPNYVFTGEGDYNITLTVIDSNGCSVTGMLVNMIQTAKPVAAFRSDTVTCLGGPIAFTNLSTNAQTFMWDFGDGDTAWIKSPTHNYRTYGNFTVKLIAFNAGGCDTSVTKVSYIHITPLHVDFNVNNTFSPCPPFACTLNNLSAGKLKYIWHFGDGYSDTAANPTHIYFYPGVYSITLIGYNALGCLDSIQYSNLITVQGPTGTFVDAPTTGCIPLQVSFSATTSGNTKSVWCDLGDGNVVPDTLNFTHSYNSVRVFHPQFVLTDFVGCSVAYPLDSIVTHTTPILQVRDTAVCPGQNISISLNNSNAYRWSPVNYLNCDTCASVTISPRANTAYTVSAVNQYGCAGQTTFNVSVEPLPVLTNIHPIQLCKNDSIILNVGTADKMVWIPGLYLSDSTALNPICSPQTSMVYAVNAYNKLGCGISTTIPVIVKDKVDASLPSDASVCTNGSLELSTIIHFASDLGVTYTWSSTGHLNDLHIANPTATFAAGAEHFQVIVSSGHCIPDTQNITVTVLPVPDIEVSESVQTTPFADVPLYAASHQDLNYHWFANDSFSCADCRRTEFYPSRSEVVYVEGTNKYGCIVRDSVVIEVQGCDGNSIFMPNTFTPNGDGVNDRFYVRSTTLSSLKSFRIFDEWGNQVFETNNLNEGWDGTVKGKAAATAVYVYIVEGKCQNGYDVMKSGNVTAIR